MSNDDKNSIPANPSANTTDSNQKHESHKTIELILNVGMVFAIVYTLFWVIWGNLPGNRTEPQAYFFEETVR